MSQALYFLYLRKWESAFQWKSKVKLLYSILPIELDQNVIIIQECIIIIGMWNKVVKWRQKVVRDRLPFGNMPAPRQIGHIN